MFSLALSKPDILNLVYLLAAAMFILGLKMLASVKTAPKGNLVSSLGMLLATVATFFFIADTQWWSLIWVGLAILIGAGVGLYLALTVQMTGMPQMVALLNGFGGVASLLVACGDYALKEVGTSTWDSLLPTGLATLIGGITLTGSLMAYGKLQGTSWAPDRPVQFMGQKALIFIMLLGMIALSGVMATQPDATGLNSFLLVVIALVSLVLGVLLVVGIGGADMPVVVSLLNAYSGLAAAMAGFVLNNSALIITGSLVGASGLILTNIMCKAMNRSLMNVLFGGVGGAKAASGGTGVQGTHREFSIEDACIILDAAQRVMVVPGYGMAVAQAQHIVKELAIELDRRGITVNYAIHPVAGRMPGHMNVLLAEAGVPYDQLLDLDQSNAELEHTDVAIVIGANDVTNPAARTDQSSPLYGMPILNVDQARTVFVIKRSMNPGFAGIQNELYFHENCGMIFGDAKKVVGHLNAELADQ